MEHRTRSKLGCITCRIRRVKCDETKPSCTRCADAKRTCDGYAPDNLPRRRLAAAVRALSAVGPACRVLGGPVPGDDAQCFDLFRLRTAPMTGTLFPCGFFPCDMLKVAHSEPAAWRAAVAMGALHRKWECDSRPFLARAGSSSSQQQREDDVAEKFSRQASQHYLGAMRLAREITDPSLAMQISLALAAVANLSGMWHDSQVHLRSGFSIVTQMLSQDANQGKIDLHNVVQSLVKLDILAMTFCDDSTPYSYTNFDRNYAVLGHYMGASTTMEGAASNILPLLRHALFLSGAQEDGQISEPDLLSAQSRLEMDMAAWEQDMKLLLLEDRRRSRRPSEKANHQRLLNSIKLYHAVLRVLVRTTTWSEPETRWDACLADFERIVRAAEDIAKATNIFNHTSAFFFLSLEPGIVMPLFLTAIRCRHPRTRRRALALLRDLLWQEGMWNSAAVAAVAERIILVEEEEEEGSGLHRKLPLDLVVEPSDDVESGLDDHGWLEPSTSPSTTPEWGEGWHVVPEEKRVVRNFISVDMASKTIELKLQLSDSSDSQTIVSVIRF